MRSALWVVLLAASCLTRTHAAPVAIISGPAATPLEQYAVQELYRYLCTLSDQDVALGGEAGTALLVGLPQTTPELATFQPALPGDLAEQEYRVTSGSLGGRPAVAITGGSPRAVLWGVYALLEHLGCVFEFSGEMLPARGHDLNLTGLSLRAKPSIRDRGLRLHLNFPMDQSSYSLPDFLAWVDRMARMKLNSVMFHCYANHPWFFARYKDVWTRQGTFFVGTHLFDGKYMLPDDMIGRSLVHNRAQYFPPELEGQEPGVELYRMAEARNREVMARCYERGMKVTVSFEPLGLPADFAAYADEWLAQGMDRGQLMRELTVARLQACMDAYPQADEYQLISVEGSTDAPPDLDLKADLRRLCDKYHVPWDEGDGAALAGGGGAGEGVNLTPYNAPATARQLEQGLYLPVVSTLRYVDLALDVLNDPRIADRMAREGKRGNVGIYLPYAQAVSLCLPALRVMMPAGGRLQLMVDYGARGTADQMATWEALRGASMDLGVMSWLEFDGSMFMPQTWPRSVFDCVRNARDLPLTSLMANHWRVSGLEADAACLAEAPWQPEASYEQWRDGHMGRVFGATNAALAAAAYEDLEKATLYCRAHLFNIGFCYEGRWTSGFGYDPAQLAEARRLYTNAAVAFASLESMASTPGGKRRAAYMRSRCDCGATHMTVVEDLGRAEGGGGLEAAQAAESAAEQYMRTYASDVHDRGDEGMLVNYHFGPARAARTMAAGLRLAQVIQGADPQPPLARWTFEGPESLRDATGHGFDATASGAPAYAPGRDGQALRLDGASWLQVAAGGGLNLPELTLAAWVNPDRTDGRRGIMVKRAGNVGAPWVFAVSDGKLSFEGCGTSGTFWPFNFSGGEVPAGQWSHVAVTFAANREIVLYLNGQPVARKAITEAGAPNGEPLVIGREAWGGEGGQLSPGLFRGLLDDLTVWKRVLTPAEIATEAAR
jgi:hypothetical protein